MRVCTRRKPYGNRTIYFNTTSKGRSICPLSGFFRPSLLDLVRKTYVTIIIIRLFFPPVFLTAENPPVSAATPCAAHRRSNAQYRTRIAAPFRRVHRERRKRSFGRESIFGIVKRGPARRRGRQTNWARA